MEPLFVTGKTRKRNHQHVIETVAYHAMKYFGAIKMKLFLHI